MHVSYQVQRVSWEARRCCPDFPLMLYRANANINLYDSSELKDIATQVSVDRLIQLITPAAVDTAGPIQIMVVEDDYPAWLAPEDTALLTPSETPYIAPKLSSATIRERIPGIIAFTQAAMAVPNTYLWGGTVAPNYDCSGLMQAAFMSQGIQLPRDAYQQEAFVQPVDFAGQIPGDLVFFGPAEKATHVGLYLGDNRYIHSSGKAIGNNGIGINELTLEGNRVDHNYFSQWRGAGRVIASYQGKLGRSDPFHCGSGTAPVDHQKMARDV